MTGCTVLRCAAAALVLAVTACSPSVSAPTGAAGASTTSQVSSPQRATTQATTIATTRATVRTTPPATTPELSPRSITVTSKQLRGHELVLDVLAPAQTRFALGADQASAVPCRDDVMVRAERIRYRVVCPGNVGTGGSLVSTVTLGDFDFTFTTPL